MKKFLSMIMVVLLVFSVMSPITVFAENGPYPNDFENIDLEDLNFSDLKMSAIMFMDFNAAADNIENAIGLVYPTEEDMPLPSVFSGASYNMDTNTLTLKNVKSKTALLAVMGMGDNFKIKLEGYNELSAIISMGMEWGASVTLVGNGELVLGRSEDALFSGVNIEADETAAFFHVEDTVKIKFYSNPDYYTDAVSITGSTITDPAEIIKLGGDVVCDAPEFKKYTVDIFEQTEAYDLELNSYDWYEFGLKKDGVYYIADEEYDEETYESTGNYLVYQVSYDELLGCYTLGESKKLKSLDGYTVITEFEPMYDENSGYYIGYTDYPDEEDDSYKIIFFPDEKEAVDLCVDENGTKYGFYHFSYEYDDGTTENITYVYNLVEHPTYGLIAVEDKTKTTLDGLTPLKIGEKEYADCYISSDLVINNGGSIIEPSKIENIKATNTNQGVKVTWSADPVAEKYRVYRRAEGEKKWTALVTLGAEKTSYTDTTAKSGKKYTYTVKAYNYVGWGAYNPTGATTVYLAAPDVAIKNSVNGVYLNWAKIAGATQYRIYRQTLSSSNWDVIGTVKTLSFTDKTAKNDKKYVYRVKAINGNATSGYNEVSQHFLATPKLSSAKNSASGVFFAWEKVNNADSYKVYRKVGNGYFKYLGTTSKTSYTDKTAKPGTTYTYSVSAHKGDISSAYNKTGLKLKHIEAPTVETKVYASSIKLSWNEIQGAKEYWVYRQATGETKWTRLTVTNKLSFNDTKVKNNQTYSYRVKAVNGNTSSGYITVKRPYLSAPKLTSVKNTNTGILFSWEKLSGVDSYKVYRKVGNGYFKYLGTTSKTSYTDKTAKPGTTYTYSVSAHKGNISSAYNKTGLKIKHIEAPTVETKVYASSIKLSWNEIQGAKEYWVYRQATGETKWTRLAVTNKLSFNDTKVKNNQTYSYRVKAVNGNTSSGYITVKQLFLATPKLSSVKNTNTGITLTWKKVSGAEGYKVYRKAGSGDFKLIATTKKASFSDDSVKSGTVYTYSVKAYSGDVSSYYNKTGLKIRYVSTNSLYYPDNVENGVQLRWHAAEKADKYYVYRKVDGEKSFKQFDIVSADELKKDQYGVLLYVDETAKNGVTYHYNLKVSYKGTLSGYAISSSVCVTCMDPVDVTYANATSDGIKIKWDKNPCATKYMILREESGSDSGYSYYYLTNDATKTTLLDENVESGKKYTYAIQAIYDVYNGKGGWSAIGKSKTVKAK